MPNSSGITVAVRDLTDMQIRDLMNLSTDNLKQAGEVGLQYALAQESYPFCDQMLQDDKIELEGGTNIVRRISLDDDGGVTFCAIFEQDQTNITDTTFPFTAPFQSMKTAAVWDRLEICRNAGSSEQLYPLMKHRINQKMLAFAQKIENSAWSAPASPTTMAFWGIPVWVVKIASQTVGVSGFYGGYPTGWSDVAGIVPATSGNGTAAIAGGKDRWRNYAGQYSGINAATLEMLRRMTIKTKFKPPVLVGGTIAPTAENYRFYCNTDSYVAIQTFLDKRGDTAVKDLTSRDGQPMFNGAPIIAVPNLDADTSNPIYQINRSVFKFYAMAGEYLRIAEAKQSALNHNMYEKWIDLTGQIVCLNRRLQGVISQ